MTYHTVPDGPDERRRLVADLRIQAERIELGLQSEYVPPRKTVKLEYEDCKACHGKGARFWGTVICSKCSGMGQVRV